MAGPVGAAPDAGSADARFAAAPKVVLHDHLDGGVRPTTVIELAAAAGVAVPTTDPDELADWFTLRAGMSIPEAWQRFHLVIAVLQRADHLHRVAREAVEDLAADGVVYAEVRFGPLSHCSAGLAPDDVVAAVLDGLAAGSAATGCTARLIVCGIRENPPAESAAAAELAVRWRDRGVVGFDLAGNEVDFPPGLHADACRIALDGGLGLTVHAGEMAGVPSIAGALDLGARRLGHGWRLIDDCRVDGGRIVEVGPVARRVLDADIPLELCITSNSCLGLAVADHPVRLLADAGFSLTVNPDDRAITTTTTSHEHALLAEHHRFTAAELAAWAVTALDAAFCDPALAARLRTEVVEPGWAAMVEA